MTQPRTMLISLAWTSALLISGPLLPGGAKAPSTRTLYSFESAGELQSIKTVNARLKRVRQKVSHGRYALEAELEAGEEPRLEFSAGPKGWDWRPFGAIGLDVTNASDEPVAFFLEVADAAGGKRAGREVRHLFIQAAETTHADHRPYPPGARSFL